MSENNLVIHSDDNVFINLSNGHKYARRDIAEGENIIKYGFAIGHATCVIKKDEHVHSHNAKTNLSELSEYQYKRVDHGVSGGESDRSFMGYVRRNGDVGIRNDIWIVNTVGCINKTAQIVAERSGALYFSHPFGCSQLGGDMEVTQKILAGLAKHPNAGGVLVLGLGCENNNLDVFRPVLGEYDEERVRFLNCQDCEDEIEDALAIVEELKALAARDQRQPGKMSRVHHKFL